MMSFGFSLLRLQALRRHCMRVLHLPGTCTRQDLAKVVGAAAAFSSEIDPKDKVYSWSAGYWFLVIDDDCGYSSYPLRCRHPWKSLVFGQFRHQSLHLYLINTYEDLKNRPSSFVILSMAADCKSQLNSFTLVSRCQYTIFVIAGRTWRAVCQTCLPLDCRSAIHCSELFLCVIAGLLQLATRKPIRSRVPWFFSEESRCDNDNWCNRGTQLPTNSVAAIVRPGPSWMHKALFALCQLCTLAQTLDVARRLDSRSRHSQANCSPKSGNWALLDVTFDEPGKYSLKGWSFCCIDVLNLCWVRAWSQIKFKSGWSLLQEIMGLHAKGPKQETLEVPPPL